MRRRPSCRWAAARFSLKKSEIMPEEKITEGTKWFEVCYAKVDHAIDPMEVGNLVKGTYEATIYKVLQVYRIRTNGRFRVLGVAIFEHGFQISWNARCKCRICRANVWRRLFFMRPHDPRINQ